MSPQVIHHDDVAWAECRHQVEPDPAEEELAVDGSINNQRCRQARGAKRREERGRLPVAVRHARKQPLTLGRPPSRTSHVRFSPRFVDEHEPIWIQLRLLLTQLLAPLRNVRPFPFRGDEDFFLMVRRSLCSAVHSV